MQQPSSSPSRRSPTPPLRSEFADDPEMSELVDLFVRELPDRLAAMASAWSAGDSQTLKRMAHQLRGSGSGYGFPSVSQAAGELESALAGCRTPTEEAELGSVKEKIEALMALCRRAAPE